MHTRVRSVKSTARPAVIPIPLAITVANAAPHTPISGKIHMPKISGGSRAMFMAVVPMVTPTKRVQVICISKPAHGHRPG